MINLSNQSNNSKITKRPRALTILEDGVITRINSELSGKLDKLCNSYIKSYGLSKCSWHIDFHKGILKSSRIDTYVRDYIVISFIANSVRSSEGDDYILSKLLRAALPLQAQALEIINSCHSEDEEFKIVVFAKAGYTPAIKDVESNYIAPFANIDGYTIECLFTIHTQLDKETAFRITDTIEDSQSINNNEVDNSYDYFVLIKSSGSGGDPFFEYRFEDVEDAEDAFLVARFPAALVAKDDKDEYQIMLMSNLSQAERAILDEQVDLLNTSALRGNEI